MSELNETINGLKEIADSKNDSVCEKLKCVKIAKDALKVIEEAYTTIGACYSKIDELIEKQWIPVSERLPDEHDTIFAKLKGTDKWNKAMCEKMSDNVTVVCVFENGKRVVSHSCTVDGKWDIERNPIKRTVTHWMPNPELPKDGDE